MQHITFFAHILFTASNSSGNNTTYPDGTVVQQPADSGEVAYYVIAGLAIASAVVSGVSIFFYDGALTEILDLVEGHSDLF